MIPKRIILTAESAYNFSPVAADCVARMRAIHRGWKVQLFTAEQRCALVAAHRPDLLELYHYYPRAVQKADLFRVIAVHQLGGIYLDTDVFLHQPLDPLLGSDLVLAEEWRMDEDTFRARHEHEVVDSRDLFQIGNYGFGAAAGHWFCEKLISEMVRRAGAINASTVSNDDVLFSTGPDVFSAVYARHRAELDSGFVLLRGRVECPPPESHFKGEGWWSQFGQYGVHIASGSWR